MRLQPGEVEPFLDSGEPPIHSVDAMLKTDEVFPDWAQLKRDEAGR